MEASSFPNTRGLVQKVPQFGDELKIHTGNIKFPNIPNGFKPKKSPQFGDPCHP
jgi:hypothetical protein